MGLFSKKKSDEELIKANLESQQAELESKGSSNKNSDDNGLNDSKIGIEVTKIQAQMEGLNEFRKITNERFTRNSEELGEIKGMVVETNKAVGRIEASATRAIDLVEVVKPDQLMLEIRKQDSKSEALKANIESNETMARDMMKEMKEMRQRMDFYKGVEQVAKMNEEIKQDLIQIKKTEGIIERHSNKIETIFLEVEKKFTDFDKYGDIAKDLQKSMGKIQEDIDKLRVRIEDKADKKELLNLITRFGEFEKHTTNIINLLDERSKSLNLEVNSKMDKELKKFQQESKEILGKISKGDYIKSSVIDIKKNIDQNVAPVAQNNVDSNGTMPIMNAVIEEKKRKSFMTGLFAKK
ncbi:MAG: hypothetical protein WC758_04610 [Candidatus Woesearchaeota archaeon]|jgi:hypothetical protein